jgi:hypothetical protein
MNSIFWRLAGFAAGMLDPTERDAVRGDLAESGSTGFEALRDVIGLVGRRQAGLLAIAIPVGILLSREAINTADESAVYAWLYFNNWCAAYLTNAGARVEMLEHSTEYMLEYLALACCAWAAGLLLGKVSRRAVSFQAVMFSLVLLLAAICFMPRPYPEFQSSVFSLPFYRVAFPLLLQTVLVFVPSLWGMRLSAVPRKEIR